MLCVIIYLNVHHHKSQTLDQIHFLLLVHPTAIHYLNPFPKPLPSLIGRGTRSDISCRIQFTGYDLNHPFWSWKVPCLFLGQVHEKWMWFTLTQVKVYSFKRRQQTHKGVSAVLKHQIKALQEDIRVCQSWLTFKGLCSTPEAILFESTKENRLLRGRL